MSNYNANNLLVLENLELVRKRPGMYIDNTNKGGLHHLIWEIIDNSNDEILNGFGNKVIIILNKDGSISIEDNGRGMPIDINTKANKNGVRVIFETVGGGGKFNNDVYKNSGGLHGVGAAVVNALSDFVDITVKRNGFIYHTRYENQKLVVDLEKIGKTSKKDTGTKVCFKPDKSIFEEGIDFDLELIVNKLTELSYLNENVPYDITDKRSNFHKIIVNEKGLLGYLSSIEKNPICPPILIKDEKEEISIECAFQYIENTTTNILSFANNIKTVEGGTHETGFKTGLSKSINDILKNYGKNKKQKELNVTSNETLTGLNVIINIKLSDPEFGGQTKTKLNNSYVKGIVHTIVSENLEKYFENKKNKKIRTDIIERICEINKINEYLQHQKEVESKKKEFIKNKKFNSKIARCNLKDNELCELFIVEGESAGGSAKQGRNRLFQTIICLKGKPSNVEKQNEKKVLENEELNMIAQEIGGGIGKDYNANKSNYNKVIIMTDADVDGTHIQLLLITFFYRYMKDLITQGKLYFAMPPLYKIYKYNSNFEEKDIHYAYSDEELNKYVKKLGSKYKIQRYKGLGEMDPEQLWETTINPEHRVLKRVTEKDCIESDKIISSLMGKDVQVRKELCFS